MAKVSDLYIVRNLDISTADTSSFGSGLCFVTLSCVKEYILNYTFSLKRKMKRGSRARRQRILNEEAEAAVTKKTKGEKGYS